MNRLYWFIVGMVIGIMIHDPFMVFADALLRQILQ